MREEEVVMSQSYREQKNGIQSQAIIRRDSMEQDRSTMTGLKDSTNFDNIVTQK